MMRILPFLIACFLPMTACSDEDLPGTTIETETTDADTDIETDDTGVARGPLDLIAEPEPKHPRPADDEPKPVKN